MSNTTNPLKWVKASERLPDDLSKIHFRDFITKEPIPYRSVTKTHSFGNTFLRFYLKPFDIEILSVAGIEWLDETPSKESNTDCSVEQAAKEFLIPKYFVSIPTIEGEVKEYNTLTETFIAGAKWSSQLKPADCSVEGSDAISFADWIGENEWHWEIDDLLGERWFKNIQSSPYLTTTQLYKLFKTPPNTEQLSGETKLGANSIQNT